MVACTDIDNLLFAQNRPILIVVQIENLSLLSPLYHAINLESLSTTHGRNSITLSIVFSNVSPNLCTA